MTIDAADLAHLRRAVELARLALERGDEPFGSLLVSGRGTVLFEDHNHVLALEPTQHPELAIARWAGARLSPTERATATVYTSGEHCPMCSAAHGWAPLGRIVDGPAPELEDEVRELHERFARTAGGSSQP